MSPVGDGYKKEDLMPAKHRCAMVQLALESSSWIRLNTWESEQPIWLETARVLSYHKSILDNKANMAVTNAPSKKQNEDNHNKDEIIHNSDSHSSINNKEVCEQDRAQLKLLCGADLLESFAVPG